MMDAHLETSAEQDLSRMREVARAEERVWKKAFEFSIRREMALQLEIVVLARHFAKKSMQVLAVAKL